MKQMAIIKGVGFGVRDTTKPMLWFDVRFSEGEGSLQCLNLKETAQLIEENQVYNIKDLEGKPCWIEIKDHTVRFLGLCKI